MATFVLLHGAGDAGWYWHLTEAQLRARGHQTIAPDLPCDIMRRLARERLGAVPDEVPGCHCVALSHPRELSELLVGYLA